MASRICAALRSTLGTNDGSVSANGSSPVNVAERNGDGWTNLEEIYQFAGAPS
jgi:hypothetical protein